MRTLITGGAGFVGRHLAEYLAYEGHAVTVLDNLITGSLDHLSHLQELPFFQFVHADIRDKTEILPYFYGMDWVFHLAAVSANNPSDCFQTNVSGTFNVLECASAAKVKKLLYASCCYDTPVNPQTPYALTKYLAEQMVMHWASIYQLPAISLRLFDVQGSQMTDLAEAFYTAAKSSIINRCLDNLGTVY
jgi:UDP-glucose 4-epimerase